MPWRITDGSARVESVTTGGFLAGLLLLWGIAGYRTTRGTAAVGAGPLAGSWGALVGMLMAATFGFSQLFWDLPRLEQRNVGSPDFLRSGWTDLHTFTIADIFESGFKVLLIGPIAVRSSVGSAPSSRGRFSPEEAVDTVKPASLRHGPDHLISTRQAAAARRAAGGASGTTGSNGSRQPLRWLSLARKSWYPFRPILT